MYVSAIIAAAGQGKRFKSKVSKVLLKIGSRTMIAYSLEALNRHPLINEIIVVANPKNIKELFAISRQGKTAKLSKVVLGGKERKDSVLKGIEAISPKADLVLVHDGARPFITASLISSLIKEARNSGAAISGVPVKATVKEAAKGLVKKTLDRAKLWEIQTPQVFEKKLLFRAYRKFGQSKVTDDAALVEKLGRAVKIVPGSYLNIKITTPEDLVIARGIAKIWKAA